MNTIPSQLEVDKRHIKEHYKLLIKNAHNHLSNDPIFTHSDIANMLSICTGINSTTIFNDIENYKEETVDVTSIDPRHELLLKQKAKLEKSLKFYGHKIYCSSVKNNGRATEDCDIAIDIKVDKAPTSLREITKCILDATDRVESDDLWIFHGIINDPYDNGNTRMYRLKFLID